LAANILAYFTLVGCYRIAHAVCCALPYQWNWREVNFTAVNRESRVFKTTDAFLNMKHRERGKGT